MTNAFSAVIIFPSNANAIRLIKMDTRVVNIMNDNNIPRTYETYFMTLISFLEKKKIKIIF